MKYSHIRTKSAIEIQIPQLKKTEFYIFVQEPKYWTNFNFREDKAQIKETKKKTFIQYNNISKNVVSSLKPKTNSKVSSLYTSERSMKVKGYLGSDQVKMNIYVNYNTIDVSRSDKIINTEINNLQKSLKIDKKFLKNGDHNFNGKRGFY